MSKKTSTYKLGIQFNTDDSRQRTAVNFLSLCGYRKNKIIGIMVEELIDKYNLENADSEQLKKFLDSYDYIKGALRNISGIQANSSTNKVSTPASVVPEAKEPAPRKNKPKKTAPPKQPTPEAEETESESTEDATYDKDKAALALSAFGL